MKVFGIPGLSFELIVLLFRMARQTEFGCENNRWQGSPVRLGPEASREIARPIFSANYRASGLLSIIFTKLVVLLVLTHILPEISLLRLVVAHSVVGSG